MVDAESKVHLNLKGHHCVNDNVANHCASILLREYVQLLPLHQTMMQSELKSIQAQTDYAMKS